MGLVGQQGRQGRHMAGTPVDQVGQALHDQLCWTSPDGTMGEEPIYRNSHSMSCLS